jgi:hypothetical protein
MTSITCAALFHEAEVAAVQSAGDEGGATSVICTPGCLTGLDRFRWELSPVVVS